MNSMAGKTRWFGSTSSSIQSEWGDFILMVNRTSIFRLLGILLTGPVWLVLPALASSQSPADEHAKLTLVSEQDALVPGKQSWIGIRFDLQDGWHTYWMNPGDSGETPRIEWQLPPGFQVSAIQWPHPERLSMPPFADYGYEHQVLLMAAVEPPGQLTKEESATIAAHVHYLVCRDVCIPGQKHLELSLPVKTRATTSSAGPLFDVTRQRLPRPTPREWKIWATSSGEEFVLMLKADKLVKGLHFFPLHAEQIENAAPQDLTEVPGGLRVRLKKSEHLLKPISRLDGVIVLAPGNAYLVGIPVSQASSE
jgi:DsbC/DsbD-like thiol-disulfide interchange protein